MGLFSCFNTKNKEEVFWTWFVKNSSRLFHFENEQEEIFNEVRLEFETNFRYHLDRWRMDNEVDR